MSYFIPLPGPDLLIWNSADLPRGYPWHGSELTHRSCWGLPWVREQMPPWSEETSSSHSSPTGCSTTQAGATISPHRPGIRIGLIWIDKELLHLTVMTCLWFSLRPTPEQCQLASRFQRLLTLLFATHRGLPPFLLPSSFF